MLKFKPLQTETKQNSSNRYDIPEEKTRMDKVEMKLLGNSKHVNSYKRK